FLFFFLVVFDRDLTRVDGVVGPARAFDLERLTGLQRGERQRVAAALDRRRGGRAYRRPAHGQRQGRRAPSDGGQRSDEPGFLILRRRRVLGRRGILRGLRGVLGRRGGGRGAVVGVGVLC